MQEAADFAVSARTGDLHFLLESIQRILIAEREVWDSLVIQDLKPVNLLVVSLFFISFLEQCNAVINLRCI